MAPRIAYLDLDGTLTRGGSMFHGERGVSLAAARAVFALHEAGIRIVPASGRTVGQLREVARLLGSDDLIAEMGSVIVREGVEQVTYDAFAWHGTHAPLGVKLADALCGEFETERYEPWYSMRRHTVLLRGRPGLAAPMAERALEIAPSVTVIDNGEVDEGAHAYHVLPSVVSKARAIEHDLHARGWSRDDAVAFGDSDGDRAMATAVGKMYHLGGENGDNVVGIPNKFGEGLEAAVHLVVQTPNRRE